MGAGEDSLEEVGVGASDGVEACEVVVELEAWTAEGVELTDCGRGVTVRRTQWGRERFLLDCGGPQATVQAATSLAKVCAQRRA